MPPVKLQTLPLIQIRLDSDPYHFDVDLDSKNHGIIALQFDLTKFMQGFILWPPGKICFFGLFCGHKGLCI